VMALRKVVVFGGAGFLGRRVAQHLLDHSVAVWVASRHRYRGGESFRRKTSKLEFVQTEIGDDRSVVAAMTGMSGVVNAVSLYLEQGRQTFHSVHVEAAARVAKHARALCVELSRTFRRPTLPVSVPFEAWRALALIAEMLPRPPITRTQVELITKTT
jgi:uncharacterized protein YbjT (DUF2867 family)